MWYLKIPAIYSGLSVFASKAYLFNTKYRYYPKQAQLKQENKADEMTLELRKIPLGVLQNAYETNQRNEQLCIPGGLGVYGLNILDAYISGKFF